MALKGDPSRILTHKQRIEYYHYSHEYYYLNYVVLRPVLQIEEGDVSDGPNTTKSGDSFYHRSALDAHKFS